MILIYNFTGKNRGRELDSQVEEAGLRESVLPAVYPDQGHQLRHQLHLPRAQGEAGGGEDRGVHPLRVSRLLGLDSSIVLNCTLYHVIYLYCVLVTNNNKFILISEVPYAMTL